MINILTIKIITIRIITVIIITVIIIIKLKITKIMIKIKNIIKMTEWCWKWMDNYLLYMKLYNKNMIMIIDMI